MKIMVPHNTSREEAKKVVEQRAANLMKQFGAQAQTVEHEWVGDVLHVRGKAMGLQIKGSVEVTETDIIVDGDLPLMARPFESKIREAVLRETDQMFRKA